MPEQPPYEEQPHHGPEGPPKEDLAIAGTGFGGPMDLGTSEAETLERTPGGPEGTGPRRSRARCGPTPGGTCAATPSSSSPGSSSSSWSSSPSGPD